MSVSLRRVLAVAAGVGVIGVFAAVAGATSGPTWTNQKLPPGLKELTGISCHGMHCVAGGEFPTGDGAVLVSDTGGKLWGPPQMGPKGTGMLYNVACSSASDCWADGQKTDGSPTLIATSDGGKTWRQVNLPKHVFGHTLRTYGLGAISCVGQHCWIDLGRTNGDIATSNGGQTWSAQTQPQTCNTFLCGPAYISTDITFVNKYDGYATGLNQCGGQHVTQCPGIVWGTTDGGAKWKILTAGRFPAMDVIACVSASRCWAGAATFKTGEMYGTANGGKTWSHQTLPSFGGYFIDLRCEATKNGDRCFAVGQNKKGTAPVIVNTTDGGYHWLLDKAPAGTGWLGQVTFVGGAGRAVGTNSTNTSAVALAS